MTFKRIGFIGAGRVARVLLGGFQRARVALQEVTASDIAAEPLEQLKSVWPSLRPCLNDNLGPARSDLVVLALHPKPLRAVLPTLAMAIGPEALVLSLAPSVTLEELARVMGTSRVARMIPNAPSLVGKGYNPVAFHDGVPLSQREALLGLFHPLGPCPEVAERDLEAYAVLSGMGPTYFWFQWEELRKLGNSFGLSSAEITEGLEAMIYGAAKMLLKSELPASFVMDTIPVRPSADEESQILEIYRKRLPSLYEKIKPAQERKP